MRIGVCSWATTNSDVQRSLDAILTLSARECGSTSFDSVNSACVQQSEACLGLDAIAVAVSKYSKHSVLSNYA
jgi:hypothetical protein